MPRRARTPGPKLTAAEIRQREDEAWRMRRLGRSWAFIATQLGFADPKGAHQAAGRAMRRAPQEERHEWVMTASEQLADLYQQALGVLGRGQPLLHRGQLVWARDATGAIRRDQAGNPIPQQDERVRLQAIDTLLRVQESFRRLAGLDAPARVRIEEVPDDVLQAERDRLVDDLGGPEAVAELERALAAGELGNP